VKKILGIACSFATCDGGPHKRAMVPFYQGFVKAGQILYSIPDYPGISSDLLQTVDMTRALLDYLVDAGE
jgi:hypothetical protein